MEGSIGEKLAEFETMVKALFNELEISEGVRVASVYVDHHAFGMRLDITYEVPPK